MSDLGENEVFGDGEAAVIAAELREKSTYHAQIVYMGHNVSERREQLVH
jgi:hypothetical protein